jgi:cellulose synthase (UDP-forming)
MSVEGFPYSELLSPLIFVLGTIYALGPMLPLSRPWARGFIFVAVWVVIARYLDWRIFTTVVPAAGEWYEVGWVYFCFATTHSSPA